MSSIRCSTPSTACSISAQGAAVLGAVDEVVNPATLSRLYGAEVEVVRVRDRVFVMAGGVDVEREAHRHEGHDHAHGTLRRDV